MQVEQVWLAPPEFAEKYETDIFVLCPFLGNPSSKCLCLQYDEHSYVGAVENEESARIQLEAKGFEYLGEL